MNEFYEEARETVAAGIRNGWVKTANHAKDLVQVGITRGWIKPAPTTKQPSTIDAKWNQNNSTSNS